MDPQGRATGRHAGVPTSGAGKAHALRRRTADPVYLAAGNSVLDVEMLQLSDDLCWAIEPDRELRRIAEREGWLITDLDGWSITEVVGDPHD